MKNKYNPENIPNTWKRVFIENQKKTIGIKNSVMNTSSCIVSGILFLLFKG